MSYFVQPVITDVAKQQVYQAVETTSALTFTRLVLGTGAFGGDLKDATAMQSQVMDLPVTKSLDQDAETIKVLARLTNESVTTELHITEIGLFAKVGTNPEFLYLYTTAENGDVVPSRQQGAYTRTYLLETTLANDGDLTVEYLMGEGIFATLEDLENHKPEIATKEEAETGNDNEKMMTPKRVKEYLEYIRNREGGLPSESMNGFMSLGQVSKLNSVETGAQINPTVATQAQAEAGTDNTTRMTPLRTKQAITKQAIVVVNHGTNASTARPSGAVAVYWIGTVEPTNATNNDLWIGG